MKKIKLESVFNEFTLMGIAVSGAFYLGEYWEGIAVILFYLIGEWFQHKAVHKARSDIKALLLLNRIFNHSNIEITKIYICIREDEINSIFDSIRL